MSTFSSKDEMKALHFHHISNAVEQSMAIVAKAKRGERLVFPTKWHKLNRQLLGGFQPTKLYVIGGRKMCAPLYSNVH